MNPYEHYSAQGKLTFRLSQNIKLSYNGFLNHNHQDRQYNQLYKYNPNGVPQSTTKSTANIFTLNHVISPTAFYDLKVNRFHRDYEQYVYADPTATPDYLVKVYADTSLGLPEEIFDSETPDGQSKLDEVKAAQRAIAMWLILMDRSVMSIPIPVMRRLVTAICAPVRICLNTIAALPIGWQVRFDQPGHRDHQIKTGLEVRLHELTLDSFTLQKGLTRIDDRDLAVQSRVPPSFQHLS